MTTLWFIIYMTFSGWNVVQIDAHPSLEERCYGSDASRFCIVAVDESAAPNNNEIQDNRQKRKQNDYYTTTTMVGDSRLLGH